MTVVEKVNSSLSDNVAFLKRYLGADYQEYVAYLSVIVEFHVAMEKAEMIRDAKLFKYNKNCKTVAIAKFIEHCEKIKEKII